METNRGLERDIELEQEDAEGVKGGGIVSASASVGGNSASVNDTSAAASAGGVGASSTLGTSGWDTTASGHGTSVSSTGRTPKAKLGKPKRPRLRRRKG